jgi:hypothetical protein
MHLSLLFNGWLRRSFSAARAGPVIPFMAKGYAITPTTTYTEEVNAAANCIIDISGQTMVRLQNYGQMYSDYYSGRGERIQIQVHTGLFSGGLPVFKNVAAYEDNPTRSDFSKSQIAIGLSENLVNPDQIQVSREGKSKTVMVEWNVPLVCPATTNTPAVTIPPGTLMIEGYGDPVSINYLPTSIGPNDWKYSIVGSYYNAHATFFCQDWDYKWLPVAEQFVGTSMQPRSSESVWTWAHP